METSSGTVELDSLDDLFDDVEPPAPVSGPRGFAKAVQQPVVDAMRAAVAKGQSPLRVLEPERRHDPKLARALVDTYHAFEDAACAFDNARPRKGEGDGDWQELGREVLRLWKLYQELRTQAGWNLALPEPLIGRWEKVSGQWRRAA